MLSKQARRADKKRWLVMILAGLLVVSLLVPMVAQFVLSAGAVTQSEIDALKEDAEALETQKEEINAKLETLKDDKAKAVEQKEVLDQQSAVLQEEIENTTALINEYTTLIEEKQVELEEAEKKEQEQYELFCERVCAMEESGSTSYVAVLFGAKDFSDLLDRFTFIQEVMDYDQSVMDALAQTRQEIADTKAVLEESKAEQEEAKQTLKAREAELDQQIQTATNLVKTMEAQSEEYQEALAELAAEEDAISDKIDSLVAQLEKQNEEQGTPIVSEGEYLWPLNGYYSLSSPYGNRTHPIAGVWRMHTGVDIPAPAGTPIRATKSGQVIVSTYGSSYGNYVSISHGGGSSSLYAHMSARAVSVGETVTQGQIIGYVGTTGSSTGNHLHFELKVNGSRINPMSVF